ncbi:hypothetical protein PYJP_07660 [Pyrofollis japonicus]|uniref:hypothetical protein n=1 Tax=Pyrofollis japonicus TaxID=3060460 RepID=UPI00295C09BD|nr:hypothetical protein [Pyrofollis japonicus]BEP17414.1 hypothetical protein PYJP_07660 [Pyrofollis japonicus]
MVQAASQGVKPTQVHLLLLLFMPLYIVSCRYIYSTVPGASNAFSVVSLSVFSYAYLVGIMLTAIAVLVSMSLRTFIDLVVSVTYSLYSLSVLRQASTLSLAAIPSAILFVAGFAAFVYSVVDAGKILFTTSRQPTRRRPLILPRT